MRKAAQRWVLSELILRDTMKQWHRWPIILMAGAFMVSIVSGVLGSSSVVAAPYTTFQGGIYEDTTWRVADGPYLITGPVTVFPDARLTIEPGVEVRFQGFISLTIRGDLQAIGTATAPITFTLAAPSVTPTAVTSGGSGHASTAICWMADAYPDESGGRTHSGASGCARRFALTPLPPPRARRPRGTRERPTSLRLACE